MSSTELFKKTLARQGYRRSEEGDQEGWLVSYADLITLLFIFFSLMLSISVVSKTKFEMMSGQFNESSSSSLREIKEHLDQDIKQQNLQAQVTTNLSDEGLQILFSEGMLFGSGQAKLSETGHSTLQRFGGLLRGVDKNYRMAIEGHTDDIPIRTPSFESNWSLSAARSVNVLHYLQGLGFDDKRMMVRAYADTRPVETLAQSKGDLEVLRAKNRRVTLLVY